MKYINILLLFLFLIVELQAQGGGSVSAWDARSIAMGKSYTVTSRGAYAIGKNPANLAFPQKHNIELSTVLPLPNFIAYGGTDFLTLDEVDYFFGGVEDPATGDMVGRTWTEDDKTRFKNLFFDGGTGIYSDISINLLTLTLYTKPEIGAFAFSISDRSSVYSSIPEDLVNFIDGNVPGQVYDLSDTELKAWYLRDYSLSYARDFSYLTKGLFRNLNAGISLKMVQGFAYASLEQSNTTMVTDAADHKITVVSDLLMRTSFSPSLGVEYDFESDTTKESNMGPFPDAAGSGFAVDFGVSAQINRVFSVGLAITDMGSIKWDQETAEYSASTEEFELDKIDDETLVDSLADAFTGEGQYVDGFTSNLATALRLGVAMNVDELLNWNIPFLVVLDYNQGFNNQPGNSTDPRVSLGMEAKPLKWLPIRTGFSFGGRDYFNWGFGLGFQLGILDIDLATTDLHSLLGGNSAKRVGVAIGSRWKF